MTVITLRLIEDVFPGKAPPAYLPAASRAVYVVDGDVTVEFRDGAHNQQAGGAWLGSGPIALLPGATGGTIWRWEVVASGRRGDGTLASAPSVTSTQKLSADLDLDDAQEWLMRCDRVNFPPGGVALTHVHQGPGIRCCLHGEIQIDTQGTEAAHGPGSSWLEVGHAPVLAPTTKREATAFIRCFLLPRGCRSRSSIRYVNTADAEKPKQQEYYVFGERFIELP